MQQSYCPRCKKKLKHQAAVLRHMNQPHSWCRKRYEFLLEVSLQKQAHTVKRQLESDRSESPPLNYVSNDSQYLGLPNLDNSSTSIFPDENMATICESESVDGPLQQDPWNHDSNYTSYHLIKYPTAAEVFGTGKTFMDIFDSDKYTPMRAENLYYPFASREEWEFAAYLSRSSLGMAEVDELLKTDLVKQMGLSFRTAKDLRSRIEILPGGPQWKVKSYKPTYPTKNVISLYYRNPLECIQSIMQSPLVKDHINFKPFQLFQSAEKAMRVYTEWLSGEMAWNMQNQVPAGATVLGVVLSSDKTNISAMTGNRQAHPLLISLANLDMDFRMKSSNHAFVLIGLLPIPKFVHRVKRLRGVLADRLFHECLDHITQPLKTAAQIGIMMSDPLGGQRLCYTPLAAYIVDTPESALIACVMGQTSSVTMASYKQFGDSFRHEPRTAQTTIAQLQAIEEHVNPWDLPAYFKAAQSFHLNGVHRPFWHNWPLSDPSNFLTPEPLHHWHKEFWDHDAKWCIKAVGAAEIDFRFAVLHPHTGMRSFKEGISTLKQVTGREHRDVQRFIVPIIADAVPKEFLIAIRSLMDFRYLSQASEIDDAMGARIQSSLQEFHSHKNFILKAGARCGEGGTPIDNWHIPKLEFMQSVLPNICANGVAIQWSADRTENAHITEVKDPARSSNNQNYEPQICRFLDRAEKCQQFDLATAVRAAHIEFRTSFGSEETVDDTASDEAEEDWDTVEITKTSSLLENIDPVSTLNGTTRYAKDYFAQAKALLKNLHLTPARTFSTPQTAIHLRRDPHLKRMLVDDAAKLFNLPDFRPALSDYLTKMNSRDSDHVSLIGGRRVSSKDSHLPFTHVEIWTKFQLQSKAYHYPHSTLPPQTINVAPSSTDWPLGQHDTVIVNTEFSKKWPSSGLSGHHIAQLRIIFHIVPPNGRMHPLKVDCFLTYVQCFDIIPQMNQTLTGSSSLRGAYPEPSAGMYLVKGARRANKDAMGDIIHLDQVRALVELTPHFSKKADRRFQKTNCLEYGEEYWVDKYFDKELFFALNNVTA